MARNELPKTRWEKKVESRLKQLEAAHTMRSAGSRELVVITVDDGVLLVRPDDLISSHLIATGRWDQHIVDVMDRLPLNRRSHALDIGAQFGAISLSMARRFDNVSSFEPNDFSFRVLAANMALNDLRNVTLYNHGLFSNNAVLSLGRPDQQEIDVPVTVDGRFDPLSTSNIASYCFTENGSGDFEKTAYRLDDMNLGPIDFIKIDVQGADGEVILGAETTLDRFRPVIVFEWEDAMSRNFNVTYADLENAFKRQKYSLDLLFEHNNKQCDYLARPMEIELS